MLALQVCFNILVTRLHKVTIYATIRIQVVGAQIETILLYRSVATMIVETDPFIANTTRISILSCISY